MDHGVVLQVVVPLAAAAACVPFRSARIAGWLAVLTAVFLFGNSLLLLDQVRASGAIRYHFGGVPAPLGVEYRLDLLGGVVLVVVSVVTVASTWWAACAARDELSTRRPELFFTTWLLCVGGSMGIVLTGDAFNAFVFLEIASLAGYVLVAHGRQREALVASFRYLLCGTVGATFILMGVGLMYAMTGTLNLDDLAARLPAVSETRAVQAGWAFVAVGLSLKAAVFPLHVWLPGAYSAAPWAVSALLAGIATKIAIYLWLRLFVGTFSPAASFEAMPVYDLLMVLGGTGALAASAVAVFQREPKRVLAWSSIAHVGYMVSGLGLGSEAGLRATVTLLVNHAVLKTTAFLALGTVAVRLGARGRVTFADLAGLSRRQPVMAGVLTFVALGLVGVPLTPGFVSKWLLIQGLLEQGLWVATAAVILSSLLAAVYVWRLIEPMWQAAPPDRQPAPAGAVPARWGLVLPPMVLCGCAVVLGLETGFSVGLVTDAVDQLLGGFR